MQSKERKTETAEWNPANLCQACDDSIDTKVSVDDEWNNRFIERFKSKVRLL